MLRNSQFGFDWNKPEYPQLFKLLGIRNDSKSAARIRKTLRRLCEKHLDVDLTVKPQQDSMKRIENELKQRYPDIFNTEEESEKRLYFACRAASAIHNNRRCSIKRTEQRRHTRKRAATKGNPSGASFIDLSELTSDSEPSESGHAEDIEGEAGVLREEADRSNYRGNRGASSWHFVPDIRGIEPSGNARSQSTRSLAAPPREFNSAVSQARNAHNTRSRSSNGGSTLPGSTRNLNLLSSSSIATNRRALQPSNTDSSPGSFPSLSSQDKMVNESTRKQVHSAMDEKENRPAGGHGPSQITLVHRFLQTCKPSMGRYLHCFVDFGCLKEDHLRSISIWPREKRKELLKKILRVGCSDGEVVSEKDIAVLENQFDNYFL